MSQSPKEESASPASVQRSRPSHREHHMDREHYQYIEDGFEHTWDKEKFEKYERSMDNPWYRRRQIEWVVALPIAAFMFAFGIKIVDLWKQGHEDCVVTDSASQQEKEACEKTNANNASASLMVFIAVGLLAMVVSIYIGKNRSGLNAAAGLALGGSALVVFSAWQGLLNKTGAVFLLLVLLVLASFGWASTHHIVRRIRSF